ncbi:MAG: rhodanese-like domain-containing protein [Ardenticatenaceae bacterium]|nr:rhodanese-like domain-containing protein [Ardenticatenaceae bacterium]
MGILDRIFGPKVPQISVRDAYALLQSAAPPIIVDVRQPAETESGSVPGALLIPLTEFGKRLHELPRERQILTICYSSHRSPFAARRLQKAGYAVQDVQGGLIAWQQAGLPLERKEV